MAEFDFTQREIPYGQNANYSDLVEKVDTSKFRPSNKKPEEDLRDLLKKSNMSKSVDDGVTTNKVNTGIKDMDISEFSTKFTADLGYKKIEGGINQIGDFSTEGNLSDGGVENLNTDTLSDGSFFDSFGKAFGRTAITSIPGFNAIADVVNTFWQREPAGLNKAIIGVDGLKEKAANRKLVPGPGNNTLNDNVHFPLGTIESNKFGALHEDKAVGFLNSLKSSDSDVKSILKNIGLEAASNSLGVLNSLTGINIGDEVAFWSPEYKGDLTTQELIALQSVNVQNIYNQKPGKIIYPTLPKQMKDEEGVQRTNKQWLKDRVQSNSIGQIYVEPYFNKQQIKVFSIPFQFNPEISEGNLTAEYATEKILGRITAARYYIGTDAGTTTIKTKYIATNLKSNDLKNYSDLDADWYNYWTGEKLKEIEWKYRSLVFPTRDAGYLVKPPIVQVYINNYAGVGNIKTIGNVLSYPIKHKGESFGASKVDRDEEYVTYGGKPVFQHTKSFLLTNNETPGEGAIKRFIVTDVKIEDMENTNGWNYDNLHGYKRGFTVTLTLAETTRNFLDQVPDFKAYYEAFNRSAEIHEAGIGDAGGASTNLFNATTKSDFDVTNDPLSVENVASRIKKMNDLNQGMRDALNLPDYTKYKGGFPDPIKYDTETKYPLPLRNSSMYINEPPEKIDTGIGGATSTNSGVNLGGINLGAIGQNSAGFSIKF